MTVATTREFAPVAALGGFMIVVFVFEDGLNVRSSFLGDIGCILDCANDGLAIAIPIVGKLGEVLFEGSIDAFRHVFNGVGLGKRQTVRAPPALTHALDFGAQKLLTDAVIAKSLSLQFVNVISICHEFLL